MSYYLSEQTKQKKRKQKKRWTLDEESALIAGVRKHGVGKWKDIVSDKKISKCFKARTNVDLKDKWRNLCTNVGVLPTDASAVSKLLAAREPKSRIWLIIMIILVFIVAGNLLYDTGEGYEEVESFEKMGVDGLPMQQMAEESCKICKLPHCILNGSLLD